MPSRIENLVRRLKRKRDPQLGDIWWMKNEDLNISHSDTWEHPVLIVRGWKHRGGLVYVSKGSSTRLPFIGDEVLEVTAEDTADGDLAKRTRFWLNEHQPASPKKLTRWQARLGKDKLNELRRRRKRIVR